MCMVLRNTNKLVGETSTAIFFTPVICTQWDWLVNTFHLMIFGMPITEVKKLYLHRFPGEHFGQLQKLAMKVWWTCCSLLLLFGDNYTETNSLFLVGFSNEWRGYSGSILTGDSHSSDEWWSGTWGNVTATLRTTMTWNNRQFPLLPKGHINYKAVVIIELHSSWYTHQISNRYCSHY